MMPRRQWLGAGVLSAWFLITSLGHLAFSEWLLKARTWPLLGAFRMLDLLPYAGATLLLVIVASQIMQARQGTHRVATTSLWLLWLSAVCLIDRWLIYSLPEYLHYPQYALLAWLLAWFYDPQRHRLVIGPILFAATLLGVADEVLQYRWVTISYSNYLDYNDFLLNLVGASAGLLLYYGFQSTPGGATTCRHQHSLCGITGFGLLALCSVAVIGYSEYQRGSNHIDQPLQPIERASNSYGHWLRGPHRGRYYVLEPWLGTLIITGLGMIITLLPLSAAGKVDPRLPKEPQNI
ncbi:MAG: hypothetical protein PF630_00165 [Gammaproteobacteria bacterium]|jgi:hypothetical protein|nr:hypothetical protein [Gammaproteobacteria bacterium]